MFRDLDRGVWRRLGSRLISRLRGPMDNPGGDGGPFEKRDAPLPTQNLGGAYCLSGDEDVGARQRAAFSQHINC